MINYKTSCVVCEEKINFNKEEFVRLTDFKGTKKTGQCFYHLNCWKNRFVITQQKMNQQANKWISQLSKELKKIKPEQLNTLVKSI